MSSYHIIIPLFISEMTTDVFLQTSYQLTKLNHVVTVIDYTTNIEKSFYTRQNNIHFLKYIDIVPIKGIRSIDILNSLIFYLFVSIFIPIITQNIKLITNKVLWIIQPWDYRLVKVISLFSKSLFDCTDYSEFKKKDDSAPIIQVMKNVSHVFFNSLTLKDLYSNFAKNYQVVPQGFRIDTFKKVNQSQIKDQSISKHKPSVGYLGGLNNRLDYKLIFKLAKSNPNINFFIFGPVVFGPNDKFYVAKNVAKLKRLKNIHLGVIDKKNVPTVIDSFDVCIIPYLASIPFNTYCYPMKIMEYFYLGKKIITSPILELKRFSDILEIAETYPEWNKKLQKLLLKKDLTFNQRKKMKKIAIDNSWARKVTAITETMNIN